MRIRSYWIRLLINLIAKAFYWALYLIFAFPITLLIITLPFDQEGPPWWFRLVLFGLLVIFSKRLWEEKDWIMHRIMFSRLPPTNQEIARWSANQHINN